MQEIKIKAIKEKYGTVMEISRD